MNDGRFIEELAERKISLTNKPGYDCPKKVQSQLAEDDPMNFSVGKIIHDLMAKELTEDVKKQILEEDSKLYF